MCGFVGAFFYNTHRRYPKERFARILDTISYRGPDDFGIEKFDKAILGHRRLSIIDIGSNAKQPLCDATGKWWIVFNGEIYNYRELRKELVQIGYNFKTESDTEVLLYGYIHWGVEILSRLKGIFAFGVWNNERSELFLARDHVGVKPLFYSDSHGVFSFASEVTPFFQFDHITKEPNYHGLDCFFTYGYIPAPMSGYAQIKQLQPGEYLSFKNKNAHKTRYWKLQPSGVKHRGKEVLLIEEFSEKFRDTVKEQMVSDVPLGVFLSGGLDSFAVAKFAVEQKPDIEAFTIGFENSAYDESSAAKASAEFLHIPLNCEILSYSNEIVDKVVAHSQDPFADSSSLAVYLLCQSTSKKVKVALSGDGADELLGGYMTYTVADMVKKYRHLPQWLRYLLHKTVPLLPDYGKYSLKEKFSRFIYGAEKGPLLEHAAWRTIIPDEIKQRIYSDKFKKEIKDFEPLRLYANYINEALEAGESYQNALMYADFSFYLPSDMLVKVDRMSMANGLEARVPFLDKSLVEYMFMLPDEMKIRGKETKYILRKMVESSQYKSLLQRKKSGFNIAPDAISLPNRIKGDFVFGEYGKFLVNYDLEVFFRSFGAKASAVVNLV